MLINLLMVNITKNNAVVKNRIIINFLTLIFWVTFARDKNIMKFKKLTLEEKEVIINKGTEAPFTGIYNNNFDNGVYVCKQCDTALFSSDSKFESSCGWPSFDNAITNAVKEIPDIDGRRTEIVCANCGGHLGHVFIGENYTKKNTRHCVNSISVEFKKK